MLTLWTHPQRGKLQTCLRWTFFLTTSTVSRRKSHESRQLSKLGRPTMIVPWTLALFPRAPSAVKNSSLHLASAKIPSMKAWTRMTFTWKVSMMTVKRRQWRKDNCWVVVRLDKHLLQLRYPQEQSRRLIQMCYLQSMRMVRPFWAYLAALLVQKISTLTRPPSTAGKWNTCKVQPVR